MVYQKWTKLNPNKSFCYHSIYYKVLFIFRDKHLSTSATIKWCLQTFVFGFASFLRLNKVKNVKSNWCLLGKFHTKEEFTAVQSIPNLNLLTVKSGPGSLQQTTIIHLADDINLSNCLMIGWLENSNWLSPLLNWIAWIHWHIFCSNLWPKSWYVLVNETSCFHPDFKTKFFHSIHLRFVHNIWSINSSMLKMV